MSIFGAALTPVKRNKLAAAGGLQNVSTSCGGKAVCTEEEEKCYSVHEPLRAKLNLPSAHFSCPVCSIPFWPTPPGY